jgi:hypothetical protein
VRCAAGHEDEEDGGVSVHDQRSKLEFLHERYDFPAWRDPPRPSESPFIVNYRIGPNELDGYRTEHVEEHKANEEWPRSFRSLWRATRDDEVLLDVVAFEADSRELARDVLVQVLGEFQAVLQRDDALGEVAFAAPGRGAVVLVVANLVFVVRTADGERKAVAAVAEQLEEHVVSRPQAGGSVVPTIDQVAVGDKLPDGSRRISLEARDPLGRPLWFKIFASGGDVLRERGELAFRPYGAERRTLTLFAINENGGVAEESTPIRDD